MYAKGVANERTRLHHKEAATPQDIIPKMRVKGILP
jgi:hypothetical protein